MIQTNNNTETRLQRILRVVRQAINGDEQNFTTGSIDRAIVLLSIPMILEMAMESLFAVVDAFFVSKISVDAVATVGLTESALTLVYSLAIGMSSAATAMVARRIGEGDREAAAVAGAQTILIALVISTLIAIPGFFYAKELLFMMSENAEVAEKGQYFTKIMLSCNLPIFLLWMLNGIFRGAGDAATAMRALWIANGVNILLDPMLIFGWGPFPELGVTGAAVATTIGRSTGVAYQLWMLMRPVKKSEQVIVSDVPEVHLRGNRIRISLRHFKPDKDVIRRLLSIAAGGSGQYLIGSVSWILMIKILAHIGTAVTAGYTIAIRIIIFTILPSWGMANAAATLVGQNLGAGFPDRAEKSAWRAGFFNMIFMGTVCAIYLSAAPFFIRLFTSEPEVIEAGSLALRIIAGGYIFYGYGMVLAQAINGAGDTRTPTIMNFVCFWLIEMPLAWLLALHWNWGQTGVYTSIVVAETILSVIAIIMFKRGKWKTVKV
jgi:putative MATE family efflux protein